MSLVHLLLPLLFVSSAIAAPAEDLIVDLPGLDYPITFNQYSGYLNGTPGRHLHYWFTESQGNPATDPLVLWLNGGPGCSSLMGLLTELGPFRVDTEGYLKPNMYSWNTVANMLFLESPACVGFSYDDNNNCVTGDAEVADMNYLAIQDFIRKFPEYADHEFFITGESYGGLYVPTLSVNVVNGLDTFPINFQGYAIGNGLLNWATNDNSLMFFGYYHALFGQTLWNNLIQNCCEDGVESQATCNFHNNTNLQCDAYTLAAFSIIYASGLNEYNLYADCLTPSGKVQSPEHLFSLRNLYRRLTKQIDLSLPLSSDPPCTDASNERKFLNDPLVREALHIPTDVQAWDICSDEVGSTYNTELDGTTPQIAYLQGFVRALIYNGDVDMACNVLGNEWDVTSLGFTTVDSRKKWTIGEEVAGYVVRYENLDFLTVRGSGHMVPQDKPQAALKMFIAFLNNQPY